MAKNKKENAVKEVDEEVVLSASGNTEGNGAIPTAVEDKEEKSPENEAEEAVIRPVNESKSEEKVEDEPKAEEAEGTLSQKTEDAAPVKEEDAAVEKPEEKPVEAKINIDDIPHKVRIKRVSAWNGIM